MTEHPSPQPWPLMPSDPVERALMEDDQRRSFVRSTGAPDPGEHPLAAEVRRLRKDTAAQVAAAAQAMREAAKRRVVQMRGRSNGPGQEQRKRTLAMVLEVLASVELPHGDALAAAVAKEREACAMLCDCASGKPDRADNDDTGLTEFGVGAISTARTLASAIRARGEGGGGDAG